MQTSYHITTYKTLQDLKETGQFSFMAVNPAFVGDFGPDEGVVVALNGSSSLWEIHSDVSNLPDPLRHSAISDEQAVILNLPKGTTTFEVVDSLVVRCRDFQFQIK